MEHQSITEWAHAVSVALGIGTAAPTGPDDSVANALVSRYEKLDKEFAALHQLLDRPDYKEWSETTAIKNQMADYSVRLEGMLKQINAKVVGSKEAIATLLDEAGRWMTDKTVLARVAVERKAKLLEALKTTEKAATEAVARGTANDRKEMEDEAGSATATVTQACAELLLDDAVAALERFQNLVKGLDVRVKTAFDNAAKRLEAVKTGEIRRVLTSGTETDKEALANAVALVKSGLDLGTLDDVGKLFDDLLREIKSIDDLHIEALKAKGEYDGIKKRYDAVMKIKVDSLAKLPDQNKLKTLQGRLGDSWKPTQEFVEQGDWNTVGEFLGDVSKLLKTANEVLESNAEALEALHLAEVEERKIQEAAKANAKLLGEQLVQQQLRQYEIDKQAGIQAGNQLFDSHANKIVQSVWKETRKHAPHGENCSISGSHRLEAIEAAISIWNGMQVNTGLFNSCWVPGGGRIDDKRNKRDKGRQEIQGNFISGWGTRGETVNVHVDLHPDDWKRLPRY